MCLPLTTFKTRFLHWDVFQGVIFSPLTVNRDAFPVLSPPTAPAAVVPPSQHPEVTVHPLTQSTQSHHLLLNPSVTCLPATCSYFLHLFFCFCWMIVGGRGTASSRRTQSVAVVSQPQPVPIVLTSLIDAPGLVHCPHCQHLVTTKVTYVPGWAAWCTCTMFVLMGWEQAQTHTHRTI